MQIIYLNKKKPKTDKETRWECVELRYLKDARRLWLKKRHDLTKLGYTEKSYIKIIMDKIKENFI